jgi:hypothetical protein
MTFRAFCDVAPCSLGVDEEWAIALMMEGINTSETSVFCNDTIRRYIPEGYNLQFYLQYTKIKLLLFPVNK